MEYIENWFCSKPPIMTDETKFDRKKTVVVSGVSKLLRDQLAKEFQSKENSTRFHEDVNRLYVCPKGQDHVLVEFGKEIPDKIGKTLTIGGTELRVEKLKTQAASNEDLSLCNVSRIWHTEEDDPVLEAVNVNDSRGNKKAISKKSRKSLLRKEDRQDHFNSHRPGLNSDQNVAPFLETKVTLQKNIVKSLEDNAEFNEILKNEDVKLNKGKLTGPWNVIFAIGQKILSLIPGFDLTGYSNDQESDSSRSSIDQLEASATSSDQSVQNKGPDESFTVSSLLLRFIIAYHYDEYQKLENICQEIRFEINEPKTDRNLKLFASKDVDRNAFSKTVDEFIDYYQDQNQKMRQEVIPVLEEDVISKVRTKFSVIIDSAKDPDKMIIYGEADNVKEVMEFLKNKVGDLGASTTTSNSSKTKGAGGSSSSSETKAASLSNKKGGKKAVVDVLSCILFQKVRLSVYQGDITNEVVDVIVNPANRYLDHAGGAAGAIVKAGGKSIQTESDEIIKKRRNLSLNPGEVVSTNSGKLPCKFIIHAVGPVWTEYLYKEEAKKVLHCAVFNALTLASDLGARNISMPAISSGIFGVPVQVCADVLFTTATDFAKNAVKTNTLLDIRFVNIDKQTSQVFIKEMKRRFGSSIQQTKVEMVHSSNDGSRELIDQVSQSQFNAWKKNPMTATKASGAIDSKMVKVTLKDTPASHRGTGDKKGNEDNKSSLNPNAPPFSSPGGHSSPRPSSYSGAVTGKPDSEKDTVRDPKGAEEEECSICLCNINDKKTLHKCGHSFCSDCIKKAFETKQQCPICSLVYAPLTGNQPPGKMIDSHQHTRLPGYESSSSGSILITYILDGGTQGPNHPNPGKPYRGTRRYAYLPENEEGRKVLKLLKKAFDQKLTFTIGRSSTSGENNVVTWNDIHHKTSMTGGPTRFGYPDPHYLSRVQEELAAKGITE